MLPIADLGVEALYHATFSDERVKEPNFYLHHFTLCKRAYICKRAKIYNRQSACDAHVCFGKIFSVLVCVHAFVFLHGWVECTKGIVEQDRDLAVRGGKISWCVVTLPYSPVFIQLWGSCLAHWLGSQDIQDQLREEKILTHFNRETGGKEQCKKN